MPRVDDVDEESVLRVSKISSFFRIVSRRSSEIAATSFTIRGSRSAIWADAVRLEPDIRIHRHRLTLKREEVVASVGGCPWRVKAPSVLAPSAANAGF